MRGNFSIKKNRRGVFLAFSKGGTARTRVYKQILFFYSTDPNGKYIFSLTPLLTINPGDVSTGPDLSNPIIANLDMDYRMRPPKSIAVAGVTPTSIRLEWTPVKGAVRYNLSIREESPTDPRQGTLEVARNETLLDMLKPNTLYKVCVRSVDQYGNNTGCSGEVTQRTLSSKLADCNY